MFSVYRRSVIRIFLLHSGYRIQPNNNPSDIKKIPPSLTLKKKKIGPQILQNLQIFNILASTVPGTEKDLNQLTEKVVSVFTKLFLLSSSLDLESRKKPFRISDLGIKKPQVQDPDPQQW
jgi:hypothetical protein